ncbi:hypothetical protein IC171_13365, partial [Clostridioides sp. ES-S-0171-01]|nr:hypothetical protein [Clostridioides sp. ES-S-0171-01]MCC0689678.1 hypothetical protein [Clostridioides sp. ES-S-0056-01]MCC0716824.1 hypothetical protein [Clostridioides sp. ES-S-0077-01]
EKNIKFLNDFVFVSDKYTGIEVDSSNKSNLVKYDANLNLIISNGNSYCTNFDIYNGYIYVINPNSSDPFQKKDLNTFETIKSYRVLYDASPRENMIIINNLIFFINYNIYRNVLSKKVYSDEKGEEL